ncbi:ABC transporter ATP-binding protein [Undibacterium sp. Ji50W]|uniref:ABC transporter ATP-binding protein n=1 Tax=Undibacterium sp. Ji50W TaxID=3413041 RepID=UPI003BF23243
MTSSVNSSENSTVNSTVNSVISARGISKHYGKKPVLDGLNFEIAPGRIVGLIGPNGSGKTTTLNAILGLGDFDGDMQVLGLDPRTQRDALMNDVCFIADVAILPRWLKVKDAIAFVEGVHPRFNRVKAEQYIANTKLKPDMKVKAMSKGMVAQLHLALIMAIDAKLLVLDEPTLGLDVVYRKQFYRNLLEDYFDENKSIIITTHQVEEVEHILSDVIFINEGKIVLDTSMEQLGARFVEVSLNPESLEQAKSLSPVDQRSVFGRSIMLFDGIGKDVLCKLGDLRQPGIADIYVAMMRGAQ